MKKNLLLSAMLLAALYGCAAGQKPQSPPSDAVLIAREDGKIRAAVVQVVQATPSIGLPGSLAWVSAAKGLPQFRVLAYSVGCETAPCPVPAAVVAEQRGEEGHAAAVGGGEGAAQAAPAVGAECEVLTPSGPRPPADQRKAPINLPGPVR